MCVSLRTDHSPRSMRTRIITIALAAAFAVSLVTLAGAWRLPGNNQGYEPVQPIAFSHKLHAGDMKVACLYCHAGAERSRYAGIPALNVCMNCHEKVTSSFAAQQQAPGAAGGVGGTAETLRCSRPRRRAGAGRGEDAGADCVAAGPPVARLRVLRSSRAHHRRRAVPAVPRPGRDAWSACGRSRRWRWAGV